MEKAHFEKIRAKILETLDKAEKKISIAVCWFTNNTLFDKICEKAKNGLEVELIILNDYINNRLDGLDFQKFIDLNGNFYFGKSENPMHNKYCIIDNKILINGSYNWTYYAENKNHENIIIHYENPDLIESFKSNFEYLKNSLQKVDKVKKYSVVDVPEMNIFGARSYLAQDYLYKAYETKNTSIIEKAFKLDPMNLDVQKKAIEYNLYPKRKTKISIGEKVHGDRLAIVIPKGTEIPCTIKHRFTTVNDKQTECMTTIVYGENPVGSKNRKLGKFNVVGIPEMEKGKPSLDTTFSINIHGTLSVKVHVRHTEVVERRSYEIKGLLAKIE